MLEGATKRVLLDLGAGLTWAGQRCEELGGVKPLVTLDASSPGCVSRL